MYKKKGILIFNLCVMKTFVIFYATSTCNDNVTVYAESFDEACETAQAFSRSRAVTILGVMDKLYYYTLRFGSYE